MRKITIITCLLAISYPIGASALTGISIGGKIGKSDYKGDVLPGSGDVGGNTSYALILGFGAAPIIDFELRGSYFKNDITYVMDVAGQPVSADFEFQDIAVTAVLTKGVFAPPGSPFSLYVGAGVGYHFLNTEVVQSVTSGNPLNPISESAAKMGAEALVGFKISPPMFPLKVFAEGSYGWIFATERINTLNVGGGLMLNF